MADWAAGSARRREMLLANGVLRSCERAASSASLASSYGESLRQAMVSRWPEGVSTALAWWRECSSRAYAVQ